MMIISTRALALALVFGGLSATSAAAQYGSTPPPAAPMTAPDSKEAPAAGRQFKLSNGARKAIIELQTAVNAKDAATIPAKLAAAQAVAKNTDDKYVIAQLQLKAATEKNVDAEIVAAIDAVIASGGAKPDESKTLLLNLGRFHYKTKQFPQAASAFERLVAIDANNPEALVLLGETRNSQGQTADAIAMFQKGIAAHAASGKPAPEEWYKRALALSFDKRLPQANGLAIDWIKAYPSPASWRDSLRIYQITGNPDEAYAIDLLRLARAAGALAGESDYYRYASLAASRGFPGEAKAVLDEGFAAKSIDRSKTIFRDVIASTSSKVAADRAALPGLETTALAAPGAKQAMVTGDAYLGYGDNAKAAALYRAALGKSGVDSNQANLRLGIALARSGDKAGATTAFNAVTGTGAVVAKYWLLWLSTRP